MPGLIAWHTQLHSIPNFSLRRGIWTIVTHTLSWVFILEEMDYILLGHFTP